MGVVLTSPRPAHGSLNWDTVIEADLAAIATGINTATTFGPADLNTFFTQSGAYRGSNLTNSPDGTAAAFMIVNTYNDGNTATQLGFKFTDNSFWTRVRNAGTWAAWTQVVTAATIQGIIGDTGWVTSSTGITAASGWTLSSAKYRIRNGLAMVGIAGAKNATAITAGTGGAIANSPVVSLPALLVPSATNGIFMNNGSAAGFAANGYASQALSQLVFTTAPSGIPASGGLDAYAEFYL